MQHADQILLATAASIGFVHTLIGVDHTLPFVVLARSEKWSLRKLWGVTALCGLAHILSSVVIGAVGVALGVSLDRLAGLQESRGQVAAWLLIGFGLSYAAWGVMRTLRGKRHSHVHAHEDGTVHDHDHNHEGGHVHAHAAKAKARGARGAAVASVMGLFIIFVLGPCEALIPMLIAPAYQRSWWMVAAVAGVFGGTTLITMLALVTAGHVGLRWRGIGWLERHMHAFAGVAIAASGLAIQLLGI